MYSETAMERFLNPRNVGEMENPSGVGTVGNARCGDIMKVYLDIREGVIQDAKFKTFGCCAAVATTSMAMEMIIGKSIEEAAALSNQAVIDALGGLPPIKAHCSCLAEEGIHAALWNYAHKHDVVIKGLKARAGEDGRHNDAFELQEVRRLNEKNETI